MNTAITQQSTSGTAPSFNRRVLEFIGKGEERAGFVARAPVSAAVIRQMTDAVGDRNPVYTDECFARGSIHGGIVAPPLWLYSWMMPGLEPEAEHARLENGTNYFHLAPGGQRRSHAERRTIRDELNVLLEEHGYASPAKTSRTSIMIIR